MASDFGDILSLRGRRDIHFETLIVFFQPFQERSLRLGRLNLFILRNIKLFRYHLIVSSFIINLLCFRFTCTI